MKHDILFISDLHLTLEKTAITRQFLDFLQHRASQAKALYILGDLFDSWVGDDDNTPPNRTIKSALRQLADSGTEIFLLQGNRDFLLGQDFCLETGIQQLPECAVIEISGQRILLTHGDLLCSDDLAYQAFRIKSHSAEWQRNVLSKPLWLRLLAARWYRLRSYFHKRGKSLDIMDVNQDTVIAFMRNYRCNTLIHGHTHRPAIYEFMLDDSPATRIVLADWKPEQSQFLCCNESGIRVELITSLSQKNR